MEVTAIAAALAVGIAGFDWVGVVAGAAALDVGRVTSALVLAWAARRLWTARDHAAILTEKLP